MQIRDFIKQASNMVTTLQHSQQFVSFDTYFRDINLKELVHNLLLIMKTYISLSEMSVAMVCSGK